MTDEIIDKAWSYIQPGDTIRWATPNFVKYGRVRFVKGRSMRVQFFDEPTERALPDAKWYHLQFKMKGPEAEEHLCVVEYRPMMRAEAVERPPQYDAHEEYINVQEACELTALDPKQLRRLIRRGTVQAHKDKNEMWVIRRSHLMEQSAKYGWI